MPGRRHGCRCTGEADGRRVEGHPARDREEQCGGRGEDGTGASRGWCRGRGRPAGDRRDGIRPQPPVHLHGAGHQHQEGGEGADDEEGEGDLDQAGDREQIDDQAQVRHDHPEQCAAIELAGGGLRHPGAAAEHDGQQVAQGAEQDLGGEADREDGDELLEPVRRADPVGCEGDEQAEAEHTQGEPGQGRAEAPTGEGHRRGGASEAHDLDQDQAEADEVDGDAERRDQAQVGQATGHEQGEPGDEQGQGSASRRASGLHPGVQHGRPEQGDRADHGQSDPAEQVQADVRDEEPFEGFAVDVGAGHQHSRRHPERQRDAGGHVVAHERREPGRQGPPRLGQQDRRVGECVAADQDAAGQHHRPPSADDARDHQDRPDGVRREPGAE